MTVGLLVRMEEDVVGRLWLDDKKHFCFQYNKEWLERSKIPLSLSLPLRYDAFLDDETEGGGINHPLISLVEVCCFPPSTGRQNS